MRAKPHSQNKEKITQIATFFPSMNHLTSSYLHIYIYIYIERERERNTNTNTDKREREKAGSNKRNPLLLLLLFSIAFSEREKSSVLLAIRVKQSRKGTTKPFGSPWEQNLHSQPLRTWWSPPSRFFIRPMLSLLPFLPLDVRLILGLSRCKIVES